MLLTWVAAVAAWDLRTRRIPNPLILVGIGLGLLWAGMQGTFLDAFAGAGLAFGVGIIPFALRALGGGDVKAAIVVGLFVGPQGVIKVLLLTAVCCGIYGLACRINRNYYRLKVDYELPVGVPLCVATWGLILTA